MLENFSTYLRSLTGDAEPAYDPQPAEQAFAPLGQLAPEDRAGLITPQTAGTILGRRLLGTQNASVSATTADSTGAINASGPGYDVIPGWTVPVSADLKDLGQAALGNAAFAENQTGVAKTGPARTDPHQSSRAQALAIDKARPGGGRSAAGQVRAVRALRRADDTPIDGRKTAPTVHRTKPSLSHPQDRPNAHFNGARPRPTQAQWREAQRLQQGVATPQGPAPHAGEARALTPAQWRALGGQLLQAREAIKQTSIQAERQHGDNADAHNAAVADTARTVDAALPAYTENATVNSARVAAAKYRKNVEAKAAGDKDEATRAAFTDRYTTFTREAAQAREKAEQARLDGDTAEADRLDRAATDYTQAAQATVTDARAAGIQLEPATGVGGGGGGDHLVADKTRVAKVKADKGSSGAVIKDQRADNSRQAGQPAGRYRDPSSDVVREATTRDFAAEEKKHSRTFLRDHGVNPAALAAVLRQGATELRAALTPAERRSARTRTHMAVRSLFEKGRLERDRLKAQGRDNNRASTSYLKARYMAARRTLYHKLTRFIKSDDFGSEIDPASAFNRRHAILPSGQESAEKAWARFRKQHPDAAFADATRAALTIALVTGALPTRFRKTFGDAVQSGNSDSALGAYDVADRFIKGNPAALKTLPPWLQRRVKIYRILKQDPAFAGKENREKLAREIKTQVPQTRSALGVAAKAPLDGLAQLFKLPLDVQAAADRRARERLKPYYGKAQAIARDSSLTHDQKTAALNHLRREAETKSRAGIDPLNWASRVAHLAVYHQKLNAWIDGSASAIAGPDLSLAEDLNRWTGRQINRWLGLSDENRESLAYIVGDLVGSKGAGKVGRLVTTGRLRPRGRLRADPDGLLKKYRRNAQTARWAKMLSADPHSMAIRRANAKRYAIGTENIGAKVPGFRGVRLGDVPRMRSGDRIGGIDLRGKWHSARSPSRREHTYVETAGGGRLYTLNFKNGTYKVHYNGFGQPEFEAKGSVWLKPDDLRLSRRDQRRRVVDKLKEQSGDTFKKMGFSSEQVRAFRKSGNISSLDVAIHHDYRVGRFLLVDAEFHQAPHVGGWKLWSFHWLHPTRKRR